MATMQSTPTDAVSLARRSWGVSRFDPTSSGGHFESYFQRANHPTRPLAFWIRYTLFAPRGRPDAAEGELWAIWFDGERHKVVTEYASAPIASCGFDRGELAVHVGAATLDDRSVKGAVGRIRWDLGYESPQPPSTLYPPSWYSRSRPKTKIATGSPNAVYRGSLDVEGEPVVVDGWVGSQTHVWAPQHGELYAWVQICGFDNEPDAFFEWSSGRIRMGPILTPMLTGGVLRFDGRDLALNSVVRVLKAKGDFKSYGYEFSSSQEGLGVRGRISAPPDMFARLRYRDTTGGTKLCLNTKVASCELVVSRAGEPDRTFVARHRAAFEVLGEERALAERGFDGGAA